MAPTPGSGLALTHPDGTAEPCVPNLHQLLPSETQKIPRDLGSPSGPSAPTLLRRRALSRDRAQHIRWRPLCGRPRPRAFPRRPRPCRRPARLDLPRVLPDVDALPPGDRDAAGEPARRHATAERRPREPLQRAASPERAPVRVALPLDSRRGCALSAGRLPIRDAQSGSRRALRPA